MEDEDVTTVDDWGFTDADHTELQSLMERTDRDAFLRIMVEISTTGGVAVDPDDGFFAGTLVAGSQGTKRMFPPGGIWRALLWRLRELHGGAETAP